MSSNDCLVSNNTCKIENLSTWTTLHSIIISKSRRASKLLSLKHPNNNKDFLLADLRVYYDNGRPTRNGICLTEFEFNYFAHALAYAQEIEQSSINRTGERSLVIKPNNAIKGVEIIQTCKGKIRKINLNGEECKKIIQNYGSFYSILDEIGDHKDIMEETPFAIDINTNENNNQDGNLVIVENDFKEH